MIVGLLIGIGAGMIGPMTKRAKYVETRDIVNSAVESVIGYAAVNNRIPDLTAVPSGTSVWSNLRTQNDAQQRQLIYIFDNNLAASACTRTSTNLALRVCNDASCTTSDTVNNVAFILASAGLNSNNQTAASQTVSSPTTTINTYISGVPVDNYAGDFARADEYDDAVKWITLSELKTKIGCTRYDLCTGGIAVNNQAGIIYFRLNGGSCTLLSYGAAVNLTTVNSYQLYTDAACTTACTPQANLNYTQQKDIDVNNNCRTRLNPGCQMVDE